MVNEINNNKNISRKELNEIIKKEKKKFKLGYRKKYPYLKTFNLIIGFGGILISIGIILLYYNTVFLSKDYISNLTMFLLFFGVIISIIALVYLQIKEKQYGHE